MLYTFFAIDFIKCFEKSNFSKTIFTILLIFSRYKLFKIQFFSSSSLFFEKQNRFRWNVFKLLLNNFKKRSISKFEFSSSRMLRNSFINIAFCNRGAKSDVSIEWSVYNKFCAYWEMSMSLVENITVIRRSVWRKNSMSAYLMTYRSVRYVSTYAQWFWWFSNCWFTFKRRFFKISTDKER